MNQDEFEAKFAALNAHLEEVRSIFDAFNAAHVFAYVNRQALGRYPRVRIARSGETTMWFDLWMELDSEGSRFEHFHPDLPYELSAGADFEEQGVRFSKCFQCFGGKRFRQVGAVLMREIEGHLPGPEAMTRQYLKENGARVRLRASGWRIGACFRHLRH